MIRCVDVQPVGQNMFMKTIIEADDGRTIDILTMGPISITPELKRKGYGKAILDYSLDAAAKMGSDIMICQREKMILSSYAKS